jgi:hypothetical protein
MAAISPTAIVTQSVHDTAYMGTIEWAWPVNDADNGQTIATGVAGLRRVAWLGSGTAATLRAAPTLAASTGVVTIATAGNNRLGTVVGWGVTARPASAATSTADSLGTPALLDVSLGLPLSGCRRRVFPMSVNDTDTWTTGIFGIQAVAWQPTSATDIVGCSVDSATGIVTFGTSGGAKTGNLIVWSRS